MKLLVLSFYFKPDLSAGSFRTSALVDQLNKRNIELEVVTTSPNRYSSYSQECEFYKVEDGIPIYRIPLPQHKSGMYDQAKAFISFYRNAIKITNKTDYDAVYATSSRLFTAFLGARIASKKGITLYLDIRDIFLDTIIEILPKSISFLVTPLLRLIENYSFRKASHINLVSKGFLNYFHEKKLDCSYSFYTNGIDKEFDNIIDSRKMLLSRKEKINILYAGNIGEGQGLHKILPKLAMHLYERANFLVIGDGGLKENLRDQMIRLSIDNIELRDPVGREKLIEEYLNADVLFLHLNNFHAFEKVLPSKLFEYAVFNRPIFAGLKGYSRDFINEEISDCVTFDPCNADDAIRKFESLEFNVKPRHEFISKFKRKKIMNEMAQNIIMTIRNNV